jgi:hypothetical protein
MKLELDICDEIRNLLDQGLPEIGGRVLVDQKFPTDKRYWPCVLVWISNTTYEHVGNRVGHRPRKGHPDLTVTMVDDAAKDGSVRNLALLAQKIDTLLVGDEGLQDQNMTLSWSQSDTPRQNGAMIAIRQHGYTMSYATREGQTTETIGS